MYLHILTPETRQGVQRKGRPGKGKEKEYAVPLLPCPHPEPVSNLHKSIEFEPIYTKQYFARKGPSIYLVYCVPGPLNELH